MITKIMLSIILLICLSGCNPDVNVVEVERSEMKTASIGGGQYFKYKIVYIEGRKFISYTSSYGCVEISGPLD
jgi:hypothetical protein